MIQLPSEWMDYIQVSPKSNALFLHLINAASQFYTCYYRLDPAISFSKTIEELATKLPATAAVEQAYIIGNDMVMVKLEPGNQDWDPAPIPGLDIVSLKQYEAMQQVPGAAESSPPPPPAIKPVVPDL